MIRWMLLAMCLRLANSCNAMCQSGLGDPGNVAKARELSLVEHHQCRDLGGVISAENAV